MEFLEIIKDFDVDIIMSKETFIEKAKNYLKKYEYSMVPFHWFARTLLENSLLYLNYSDLYGHPFYQYLVQQLRKQKDEFGFLNLIRRRTSINDMAWEKTQYTSGNLINPLNDSELSVLEKLAKSAFESSEKNLNPKYLLRLFTNTEYRTNKRLERFSEILKLRWRVIFHFPAFDLEQIAFKIRMNSKTAFDDIFHSRNEEQSIFNTSTIYQDRKNKNILMGIFVIPTYFTNDLNHFLKELKENNLVKRVSFDRVVQVQMSISFSRYKSNRGWTELNKSEREELEARLKSKRPRRTKTSLNYYLTPVPNFDWNYNQGQDKNAIITQFCRLLKIFRYPDLPVLPKKDRNIIKGLYENKVAHNAFYSLRLLQEYSYNDFWIKLPKTIPFSQVSRLLAYLPATAIFTTENSRYVWTRLRSSDVELLKILKIEIHSTILKTFPVKMTASFYNTKKQKWKKPILSLPNNIVL